MTGLLTADRNRGSDGSELTDVQDGGTMGSLFRVGGVSDGNEAIEFQDVFNRGQGIGR